MSKNNVELRDFLKSHRYILGRKLGEGYFREVYEVVHSKGHLCKRLVAKVIQENPTESIQHQINCSKGNLHVRELETLSTVQHPNIIQIYDLLEDDKRFIVVEEHFDAVSLEDKVRVQGPVLNNDFFREIFSQVSGALRYLHVDRKMLHRDIKPSNILVGRQLDLAKIIDFQNAAFYEDVEDKLLPTRGGTDYTHPDLLNGLLTGWPTRASLASEFYALGATMFYALTGMAPFNYQLVHADNGIPLEIGNETRQVALLLDDEKLPSITVDVHEALLEERIKLIPTNYRDLVHNCLSVQNKAYDSLDPKEAHTQFKKDFQEAMEHEAEFPKPFEAMFQRELASVQTVQEPLFLKEESETEMLLMIKRLVKIIKQYGARELTSDVSSSGFGSDSQYKAISEEKYVLADDTVRMELRDEVFHASDGTWSPGWWETYTRNLTVELEGKIVLQADRRLEMESGNIHEDYGRQGALPWHVVKAEREGLEKALMEFRGGSSYRFMESILTLAQGEDLRWQSPKPGTYTALVKGWEYTVRTIPSGTLQEGKSYSLEEYAALEKKYGVNKKIVEDWKVEVIKVGEEDDNYWLEFYPVTGGVKYTLQKGIPAPMFEKIRTIYLSAQRKAK